MHDGGGSTAVAPQQTDAIVKTAIMANSVTNRFIESPPVNVITFSPENFAISGSPGTAS
jgi:hypothetical protein